MNLQRIIQAETCLRRLESRLGCLLEPVLQSELNDAYAVLAEVRHFAVCWEDSKALDKDNREQALKHRQACIDRLVQSLRPD